MRIAFMGTPDFAVPTLDALVSAGHDVVAVYSQPPRPAGRGKAARPSPVHARAEALGLPVHTPVTLRDAEAQAAFAALDLDVAVVAAYGLILPEPVLQAPRHGCLNVHASLLPRWRGAAPIQRAILAGDEQTGVTIMQMEKGLDTGAMLDVSTTPVDRKTAGQLTDELAQTGARQMVDVLGRLPLIRPVPQPDEGVTYAAKIDKAEARIDWNARAHDVLRHIHGLSPFPGAWCEMPMDGEQVRVKLLRCELAEGAGSPGSLLDDRLTIACGEGAIRILELQRAGKPPMKADVFLNGTPLTPPLRLV